MSRCPRVLLAIAVVAVHGCEVGSTTAAETAVQPEKVAVVQDPDLTDPLGRAVAASAARVAPGWNKVDKLWRGELRSREALGFLAVLPYGRCYRFVGAGGAAITDFDLVLLDPNGVEIQRDVAQDSAPILGVDASICPEYPGAYRIEARPRTGTGPIAIGLYRDPR
jgi:hypothetical protein